MEQSVRSDSTPVSAGHDTTGRLDSDRGREAAIAKMLTGEVETGSAVAAAIRLHEEAYGQRLYAEAYRRPDADARAGQERDAFRRLLHTQLVSDTDRQAYALAVIGRAAGVYGAEFENSGRSAWMPTAYRNLAFGEYAPEAIRNDVDRLNLQPTVSADQGAALTPDPIFAAIEESRRLSAVWDEAYHLPLIGKDLDAEINAAAARLHQHSSAVLLTTVPRTPEGCAALCRYALAIKAEQGFNLDESPEGDANLRILDLIARSPMLPSPAPSADLAEACIEQVKRLCHWDANPGSLSEAEGDAEMDRWGAVTRRAIEESSAGPRDLAGKACLSLHDMDRFLPERTHSDDLHRLLRVILREAIDMGGIARPASRPEAEEGATHSDAALLSAINEHRLAERAFHASVNPADDEWVRQNGGDTSEPAMAAPRKASAEAEARASQAWRDLFKVRPKTLNGLCRLLEHVSEHFDAHSMMADDPPDVFGMLSASADGLLHTSFEVSPPHDLSKLSILQLELLADLCRRQAQTLGMATLYPACQPPEDRRYNDNPLHDILDVEETRIAILGDMAGREIERRRPECAWDRNLRLETLIRAELAGNGYIEPALLAEAVAAWGTP